MCYRNHKIADEKIAFIPGEDRAKKSYKFGGFKKNVPLQMKVAKSNLTMNEYRFINIYQEPTEKQLAQLMQEVAEEAKERWVTPRAAYFSEIKQMVASPMGKPVLIVIAGPNGSGKTYTTRLVVKHEWAE